MINRILDENMYEIMRYLDPLEIVDFVKVFRIPTNIVNWPLTFYGNTILECVLAVYEEREDNLVLVKRLMESHPSNLQETINALSMHYSLGHITEKFFNRTYDVICPGKLRMTRSGKCYNFCE